MTLAEIDLTAVALLNAANELNDMTPDALAYIREALLDAKADIERALERVKEAA